MTEQPKETPKYELIAGIVSGPESVQDLKKHLDEGYRPDPVLMPTGRPNVVDGIGAIYHLIKLPTDPHEAEAALVEYSNSQPSYLWTHIEGVKAILHKQEMALKERIILEEHPVPADDEVAFIIEVANKEEDMKAAYEKGYRVIPDKVYQKSTVMRLMKANMKPEKPAEEPVKPDG
jgi:hypothetical protein